jgi:hypothetical protein
MNQPHISIKRAALLGGALVLAALVMAVLLRDVVEMVIIRPMAYLLWLLSIIYRIIPQPVLWLGLVLLMSYLMLGRMIKGVRLGGEVEVPHRKVLGPVADMANLIERKDGGIYFKWKIARSLAMIAVEIEELRTHQRPRQLVFDEQVVSSRVRKYLDAGLNTSFSDYPLARSWFVPGWLMNVLRKYLPSNFSKLTDQSAQPTPFDGDIGPVVDFLESQMENNNDFRRS